MLQELRRHNLVQVIKPTVEGWFWATAIVLLLYVLMPAGAWTHDWQPTTFSGLLRDDFARRFDGGCSGWSQDLAIRMAVAEVVSWYAYVTIAFVLYRLHPAPRYLKHTKLTIVAIYWLFIFCGSTHLMTAYCCFHPVYNMSVLLIYLNTLAAYLGAFRIAYSLAFAFMIMKRTKQRVDKIIALAAKHGIDTGVADASFDGVATDEADHANQTQGEF